MFLEVATGGSLVTGVTGIFEVLGAGVTFIVKDVFIDVIVMQVFTQPIVWVGAAIGIGVMLFSKFKKPLN